MTKLNKVAARHNGNFRGLVFFAATLQNEFAENANKSYHAYKVIVGLHIYNKILGIGLAGHPTNKTKSLALIKF